MTIDTLLIANACYPLPISPAFTQSIKQVISKQVTEDITLPNVIVLNFKDPKYSVDSGGFHPVEVMLKKGNKAYIIQYITDFAYVGEGDMAELAKESDFDFADGIFQNLYGVYPIEQAHEYYQIWEQNFLNYLNEFEVYDISMQS